MLNVSIARSRLVRSSEARALALDLGGSLGLYLVAAMTLDLAFHPLLWMFFGCVNALRIWTLAGGVVPSHASPAAPPLQGRST